MSAFRYRPLIVMDFETTGYNPDIHDIIEMGAVRVQQSDLGFGPDYRFERKIKIQHPDTAQSAALAVNGYTPEAWAGAIDLREALREFRYFAYDGIFCAWNITFEYRFLCEAFRRAEMENIFLERHYSHHIDIPSVVWSRFPALESLSYEKTSEKLGIESEPRPHRALGGAIHNLQMLRAIRKAQ
jgi:DNA polymerase III alpha subunit (gram-positive type)